MVHWVVLLALVAIEVLALRWWLLRQYLPVFFNGWAAQIYSIALAVDFVITWLVSMMYRPGGTIGGQLVALLGVLMVVIVFAMTLFFKWVVRHDISDIPK